MATSSALSGVVVQRCGGGVGQNNGCQSHQQLEQDLVRLHSGACESKHPQSGEEFLSVRDASRRKRVSHCRQNVDEFVDKLLHVQHLERIRFFPLASTWFGSRHLIPSIPICRIWSLLCPLEVVDRVLSLRLVFPMEKDFRRKRGPELSTHCCFWCLSSPFLRLQECFIVHVSQQPKIGLFFCAILN